MEQRLNQIENRQDTLEATFKMYMQRQDERDQQMREELREMRARQEADMREMRAKHDKLEAKQDRKDMYALVDRIETKLDKKFDIMCNKLDIINNYLKILNILIIAGIGAIILLDIVFMNSTLSKGG